MFLWWCNISLSFYVPWRLCCHLCIWRKSHILHSLLISFKRIRPSVISIKDKGFSMDRLSPHFLLPSCGRVFFNIICLPFNLWSQAEWWHYTFSCFIVMLNAYICVLSPKPVELRWLSACFLAICKGFHSLFLREGTGSWQQGAQRIWGEFRVVEVIHRHAIHKNLWQTLWWIPWSG